MVPGDAEHLGMDGEEETIDPSNIRICDRGELSVRAKRVPPYKKLLVDCYTIPLQLLYHLSPLRS